MFEYFRDTQDRAPDTCTTYGTIHHQRFINNLNGELPPYDAFPPPYTSQPTAPALLDLPRHP